MRPGTLAPAYCKADGPKNQEHHGGDPQKMKGETEPEKKQDNEQARSRTIDILSTCGRALKNYQC
jgi:hypothetical protein